MTKSEPSMGNSVTSRTSQSSSRKSVRTKVWRRRDPKPRRANNDDDSASPWGSGTSTFFSTSPRRTVSARLEFFVGGTKRWGDDDAGNTEASPGMADNAALASASESTRRPHASAADSSSDVDSSSLALSTASNRSPSARRGSSLRPSRATNSTESRSGPNRCISPRAVVCRSYTTAISSRSQWSS